MVYTLYANRNGQKPNAQVSIGGEQNVDGTAQIPLNTWTHLAATFDGAALKLYVNGAQVGSTPLAGNIALSNGVLRIGGNNSFPEWFQGQIDEIRVYNKALTPAEIQADMNKSIGTPDTTPPSTPTNFAKTGSTATTISTSWTASTDNVAVASYNLYDGATQVGTATGTTYTFTGYTCGTSHNLAVEAVDTSGNVSAAKATLTASTGACDTTPPTVSITAPVGGTTVSGSVAVNANASDNDSVAGVQFKLDGANLQAEDTTSPYGVLWDTTTATNGSHTLTAVARDPSNNTTTSAAVTVTVNNVGPPPPTGLVAAYSFDEGSGTTVADLSGNGNNGTVANTNWTTTGKYGNALSFNGTNAWVTVPDSASLDITRMTLEAWVNPTALGSAWRTVIFKETSGNNTTYDLYANRNTQVPNAQVNIGGERNVNGTAQIPLNTWTHLAATYDGANLTLYVNGTQVGTLALTGNIVLSTGVLRIGGNTAFPEWFQGQIDEIRVYNKALTQAEIQTDMNKSVGIPDTTPPSAPTNFAKTSATATSISTSWTAATDNVAVASYNMYDGATKVGTSPTTSYTFTGLGCGTSHNLAVETVDTSGNVSATKATLTASTNACDTTPPTVSITAPVGGTTVSGSVAVNANAADNDSVAGVQFKLDGNNLQAEDTTSPYSVSWDTTTAANGSHTLTAVARDASNNTTTSAPVAVTVNNTGPPPPTGLVGGWGFDEGTGTTTADASGNNNNGTLSGGPTWAPGKFGTAVSFDGVNDLVTVPDSASLDVTRVTMEAWVNPSALGGVWRPAVFKAQSGDMVYDLYASTSANVPNAGVSIGGEKATNGSAALPLNTWSHLAATYDGTTLRLYVNATQVGSLAVTGNIAVSSGALTIGGNTVFGEWFKGLIDEVRVYNKALTQAEIQADMTRRVAADTTAPVIASKTPAPNVIDVPVTSAVKVGFNEAMDPTTITTSTIQLRDASNNLVSATASYDPNTGTATLTPSGGLAYGAVYTATVKGGTGGVKDSSSNPLAADATWSFTTEPPPPPILVVGSTANPFSNYTSEILRGEGLNEFSTLDVSFLNPTVLNFYDVVVLGDVTLNAAQVTALTNWVNAGGNLIALSPDKQLAGLLGLTDAASTLAEGYLLVNTASGPGAGIVGQTIQFHGTADRYTLNGATSIATLYSNATTATSNPAVTLRDVGANGGQAAAFTFDLAKSIVYTRQGNPAWAGQDRDGIAPIRSNDLFFGGASTDWVNTAKIGIPQGDEQQRLLANMITLMARDRKPIPRLWYLPFGKKAALVMSGDDHAVGGTAGRFDAYKAKSPPGCVVANWECVRSTSYIYPASPLTNAQAASYTADGFEVALHLLTGQPCSTANWTPGSIDSDLTNQLAQFAAKYTSVPAPVTNRTHCVAWSDWATEPKVELAHGIRLDTNYYHYPGSWIGNTPGYMNGTAEIMRFADLDGTTIDEFQAETHMTDESGQTYPFTADSLFDKATGPEGYYGVYTANMHTDNVASPESDATIASAQTRGIPIVSAKQMYTWVDGRDRSSMVDFSYTGNTLRFSLRVGSGANGLQVMIPTQSGSGTLQSITRNGGNVSFTTQVIKGVSYAFASGVAGDYAAVYG
jgi:chitodextrinase